MRYRFRPKRKKALDNEGFLCWFEFAAPNHAFLMPARLSDEHTWGVYFAQDLRPMGTMTSDRTMTST